MPKRQKQGVLCLEGNWDHRQRLTNSSTVRPILDLLAGQKQINFIHKDVATADELKHYLRKWLQKQYQAYNIGYMAFHGAPGALCVGKEDVSLDELAEIIDGKGSGRILYFGSCSTLATDQEDEIKQFLKETKIKAVCGYSATFLGLSPQRSKCFSLMRFPGTNESTQQTTFCRRTTQTSANA